MALLVIVQSKGPAVEDHAAPRPLEPLAHALAAQGHDVVEVTSDDDGLGGLVRRSDAVVVGSLHPCPRELARLAWLTRCAPRMVYAPGCPVRCATDPPAGRRCPHRPECRSCDRGAVHLAAIRRAGGRVDHSPRSHAELLRAVTEVLAGPRSAPPMPDLRRFVVWGHALGLGDAISLLPMAHALAQRCAQRPGLVVPRAYLDLLQSAWPAPIVAHEGFDPTTLERDTTIVEVTVGQNARHVGLLEARLVHLDLSRQAGADGQVHENLLSFLARGGVGALVGAPCIPLSATELAGAVHRLEAHGLDPSRDRLVGVHPGAGRPDKRWPESRFRSLIARMRAELGVRVLLVLGLGEEGLRPAMGEVSMVSMGEPLREVAALLHACTAFVGNDSGLSHLAAAVGVPPVTIFGPMSPRTWKSAHPRARVLDGAGDVCAITPAQVLEALEGLLEERAP